MSEKSEYTSLDGYRFERKYIGTDIDTRSTEIIVKMNPACFKPIYKERYINNIYFDTDKFDFYYDNVIGRHDRLKFRIRWYGNLYKNIENPILELKIKQGLVGTKKTFNLVNFEFKKNFDFDSLWAVFEKSNLPVDVIFKLKNLKPTLVNRYKRKYFRDFSGDFRLTIDKEIEYYPCSQIFFGKIIQKVTDYHVIELKYDNNKDKRAQEISQFLPFRLTKNSKYANGTELFYYLID